MKKLIFVLLILVLLYCLKADQIVESISPELFAAKLDTLKSTETPYLLLDIRTYPEFSQGHIEHAQQLDFYGKDFIAKLDKLPRDINYLIYCRSGNRTNQTLAIMKQLGFQKVYDLKGGIKSWIQSGYKLVR